jgi:hypothetical protein
MFMQISGGSDANNAQTGARRAAAVLLAVCAAFQLGIGVYFAVLRPPLLPEDLRFLSAGLGGLAEAAPRLEPWLRLVFTVLGGQMAAVGVLTAAVAFRLSGQVVIDGREFVLLGAAGALSVGTMSAVNFALRSDFRWWLVLPVAAWTVAVILAALDARRASSKTLERGHGH